MTFVIPALCGRGRRATASRPWGDIGHLYYPGCFRCHDGQHKSTEGKVIRKECAICHTILSQEEGGPPMASVPSTPHDIDVFGMAKVVRSTNS